MLTGPDKKVLSSLVKDPKFDAFLKLVEEIRARWGSRSVVRDSEFQTILEVGRQEGRREAFDELMNALTEMTE